jgi:large subunit ribosomal protein L23
LYGDRQYTFIVDRSLTKIQIKYIIENIFNVKVISVNTSILPTKMRRVGKFIGKRTLYKKAYVKLKEGDTIADLFN